MLTVVMECHDHEPELAQTLAALVAGAVEGVISDVVVLDHAASEGLARIADAAGCRYHRQWKSAEVVTEARGQWLLLIEPGARLGAGWIEEVAEYIALNAQPAHFSQARAYRLPFYQRLARRRPPLEDGLLISKQQAMSLVKTGSELLQLARGAKSRRLSAEIIPSRVARQVRS